MKTYNLEAAATFLNVGTTTMIELAGLGIIPGAKIGKEWVFTDEGLESYLRDEITKQTAERRGGKPEKDLQKKRVPTALSRVSRRRPAPPPSLSMDGA